METLDTYSSSESSLRLSSFTCKDFRVYSSFSLSDIGPLTIFSGPNAVGKTSILEGINLITGLTSFRTSKISQAIKWDTSQASVEGHLSGGNRELDISLTISAKQRIYRLNDNKKRVSSLTGLLPSVVFTPDDLQMVKGAPAVRRKEIDTLGIQVSKNFYAVHSDYAKLLKQKNQALKDEASDVFIDSIDELLVRVGVQVIQHRMYLITLLQKPFQDFYHALTEDAEHAALVYRPCWLKHQEELAEDCYTFNKEEALADFFSYLQDHRIAERAQHHSLVGPHKDEITFLLNGHDAAHFASQGQQRSLVLAYKLAESSVIQQILSQKPLLLLDDVMSELDEKRRTFFMEFIADDIQTFITSTNLSYFSSSLLNQSTIVRL